MLLAAAPLGLATLAARIAVVLTERGLGGRSSDLDDRLRGLARERGPRADAARRLADRWAAAAGGARSEPSPAPDAAAQVLALAFPDRIARRRGGAGSPYIMANGRAVTVADGDPLASAAWLVVGDAAGSAAGARVLLAAALDPARVEALFADRIVAATVLAFDATCRGVVAETVRRLGAIVVGRAPADRPDPALIAAALRQGVIDHGVAQLPWGERSRALRARAAFASTNGFNDLPDLSDAALARPDR